MTEAFSDSELPYRVDLVDWHGIDSRWRRTILAERVRMITDTHRHTGGY